MPEATYAVIKTGGKQYRVQEGQTLLVEKLAVDEGATIDLQPLLVAGDGDPVIDATALGKAKVRATVVGHERGPKLRVFKFKPKRGYKRRTGHRQDLTRIQIDTIQSGSAARKAAPKPQTPKASRAGQAAAAKTDEEG